jgi:hypothetical protein
MTMTQSPDLQNAQTLDVDLLQTGGLVAVVGMGYVGLPTALSVLEDPLPVGSAWCWTHRSRHRYGPRRRHPGAAGACWPEAL